MKKKMYMDAKSKKEEKKTLIFTSFFFLSSLSFSPLPTRPPSLLIPLCLFLIINLFSDSTSLPILFLYLSLSFQFPHLILFFTSLFLTLFFSSFFFPFIFSLFPHLLYVLFSHYFHLPILILLSLFLFLSFALVLLSLSSRNVLPFSWSLQRI